MRYTGRTYTFLMMVVWALLLGGCGGGEDAVLMLAEEDMSKDMEHLRTNDKDQGKDEDLSDIEDTQITNWSEIEALAQEYQVINNVPGMSIIVREGEKQRILNLGVRTKGTTIPITDDTRFNLASITKLLTSLLFFGFIEEETLTLESTLLEMAPKLSFLKEHETSANITLLQMLRHSSGLGVPGYLIQTPNINVTNVKDARALVFEQTKWPRLLKPDQVWNYNNQVYSLLGYLAEVRGDMAFEALLRTKVLEQIGMKHSGYVGVEGFPLGPMTSMHARGMVQSALPWSGVGVAHGGLWSSPEDMGNLMRALLDRDGILSEKTWETFYENRIGVESFGDENSRWGPGYEVIHADGEAFLGHGGGYIGVAADMLVNRERKTGVTILVNTSELQQPVRSLTLKIHEQLLKKPLGSKPAFSVDLSQKRFFSSPLLGDFVINSHENGTNLIYFDKWDHSTRFVPLGANTVGFELPMNIVQEAYGHLYYQGTKFTAVLYEAEDGQYYFVQRFDVGLPFE